MHTTKYLVIYVFSIGNDINDNNPHIVAGSKTRRSVCISNWIRLLRDRNGLLLLVISDEDDVDWRCVFLSLKLIC